MPRTSGWPNTYQQAQASHQIDWLEVYAGGQMVIRRSTGLLARRQCRSLGGPGERVPLPVVIRSR